MKLSVNNGFVQIPKKQKYYLLETLNDDYTIEDIDIIIDTVYTNKYMSTQYILELFAASGYTTIGEEEVMGVSSWCDNIIPTLKLMFNGDI